MDSLDGGNKSDLMLNCPFMLKSSLYFLLSRKEGKEPTQTETNSGSIGKLCLGIHSMGIPADCFTVSAYSEAHSDGEVS